MNRIPTAIYGAAHFVLPAVGALTIGGILYATTDSVTEGTFLAILYAALLIGGSGIAGALVWLGIMTWMDRS